MVLIDGQEGLIWEVLYLNTPGNKMKNKIYKSSPWINQMKCLKFQHDSYLFIVH